MRVQQAQQRAAQAIAAAATRSGNDAVDAHRVAVEQQHSAEQLHRFNQWISSVGAGTGLAHDPEQLVLPSELHCLELPVHGARADALLDWVYPPNELAALHARSTVDDEGATALADWLAKRALVTPINKTVDRINDEMTERFLPHVAPIVLHSADALTEEDHGATTVDVLNSQNYPNFPRHELRLKPGMPLMITINLSPADGLCNGTRVIFQRLGGTAAHGVLVCTLATGPRRGEVVLIPRVCLSADRERYGFRWTRLQFPVRLCFAMTINKCVRIARVPNCLRVHTPVG